MASRDINKLKPGCKEKAYALLERAPFEVLIYCTGRSAVEQAKLYRQSRTKAVIEHKISVYEKYGHYELAKILRDVGPQHGPHVTKAGPGESIHQYWLAFDAVPIINGKLAWDTKKYADQWSVIGKIATELGLNWGGNWPKWADFPHFQDAPSGNPLKLGWKDCIFTEDDL
jgi:peptidoglycan L-alanyl-D-glutamate endopeptidase CwlK